ncbi:MAG TPA: hypothetical protein VFR06_08615 [Gallionellaceae bacterium]|nr:hypothetical protein [Gallionellaceae bacterium]
MVRGILYYLLVWLVVSAGLFGYHHLSRREKMNVWRCTGYGLLTATVALGLVLLMVYLF